MAKTIAEINEKIRKGTAVVLTAEEVIGFAAAKGSEEGGPGSGRGDNGDIWSHVFFRAPISTWVTRNPGSSWEGEKPV